jgi:uncharacterized protein (DUF433 family)
MSIDRFSTPLYTIGEAAAYLGVPPSTLATWAYGYERRRPSAGIAIGDPVITATRPARRHEAAVPFIGLAEACALAAFRRAGIPMQQIRPAIRALHQELGLEYALASQRLLTDKPKILGRSLRRIEFASDGYAQVIQLPRYCVAEVTVDPDHCFGRHRFARGGAALEDVIDLFRTGKTIDAVAAEFGLSRDDVEDAVRVNSRPAA